MLSKKLVLSLCIAALMLACKSKDPDLDRSTSSSTSASSSSQAPRVISCPICDEEASERWSTEVEGRRVRFHSVLCLNAFRNLEDVEQKRLAQQQRPGR